MKRNVLVGVRFSPEEHAYLCEQAEKMWKPRRETGRKSVCLYPKTSVGKVWIPRRNTDPKSLKELTYQFRKSGRTSTRQPNSYTLDMSPWRQLVDCKKYERFGTTAGRNERGIQTNLWQSQNIKH